LKNSVPSSLHHLFVEEVVRDPRDTFSVEKLEGTAWEVVRAAFEGLPLVSYVVNWVVAALGVYFLSEAVAQIRP